MSSNVKKFLHKVAYDHFTLVVKVSGSSGVAHTMKVLNAKHLYIPPPSIPTTLSYEAPLVAEVGISLGASNHFTKVLHVVEIVCEHNIY